MKWYHHAVAITWALVGLFSTSGGVSLGSILGALIIPYVIVWVATELWPSSESGEGTSDEEAAA